MFARVLASSPKRNDFRDLHQSGVHLEVAFRNYSLKNIRGHKSQNSTGTRCRGFLALESRCRGFLVLESRCRGFLSPEKTPWNNDFVAYLSLVLDVVVFWS